MPTARELLEQADALMRRNRKRGRGPLDAPTLTDVLGVDRDTLLAATVILPETNADAATPIDLERLNEIGTAASATAPDADPMSLDTLADVPVLTDAVLAWPPRDERIPAESDDSQVEAGAVEAFPASAAEAQVVAAALPPPEVLEQASGEAPPVAHDAVPVVEASTAIPSNVPRLEDDFILEIPPPAEAAVAVDAGTPSAPLPSPIPSVPAPAAMAPQSRDWDALAEEIRMQVLQRLDLFTDTGMRDQLGAHLSPIVERASAQLVETINRELGKLVRGYVAEAIEREIDTWRNRGP